MLRIEDEIYETCPESVFLPFLLDWMFAGVLPGVHGTG
jgi:hypothetical protein